MAEKKENFSLPSPQLLIGHIKRASRSGPLAIKSPEGPWKFGNRTRGVYGLRFPLGLSQWSKHLQDGCGCAQRLKTGTGWI